MFKKIITVLLISLLILSISGCTDEVVEETPATESDNVTTTITTVTVDNIPEGSNSTGLLPVDVLPDGYVFLGSHELSIDDVEGDYVSVSGILGGAEGFYKYQDSTDAYINIIELNSTSSAEEFITEYQAGFNGLRSGDRFTDVSVNEHSAVMVLEYVTIGTSDIERHTYIWNNGVYVFVVHGATEDETVVSMLAEATGY
ncbi:hypothetical protein [Methanolobus vulcani]|uniref:DUF4367 domain-containing protein n=1 Tax=Methanolobus vulcani TaxID=38026 RepID=A0A7Z8P5D2_9EURY|nr:hypothetical protein [Methanolobus vulcani]TQD28201.1 hypothetical protein FKV42_00560 [Methanolobus vulcani]